MLLQVLTCTTNSTNVSREILFLTPRLCTQTPAKYPHESEELCSNLFLAMQCVNHSSFTVSHTSISRSKDRAKNFPGSDIQYLQVRLNISFSEEIQQKGSSTVVFF